MRKILAILALMVPLTISVAACEQDAYEEGEIIEEE